MFVFSPSACSHITVFSTHKHNGAANSSKYLYIRYIYIYIYLFIYLDLYYYAYNVLQDYKESMMGQGDKDDFIQTLGLSLLQCAWLY